MSPDEQAFLDAIAADPEDQAVRLVFADWLDEAGRPEDAARHREWAALLPEAVAWLRGIAVGEQTIANSDDRYEPDPTGAGSILTIHDGRLVPSRFREDFAEEWRDVTFEDIVQAGRDYAASGGEDYFVQHGAEGLRDRAGGEAAATYWKYWQAVTCEPVPDAPEWCAGRGGPPAPFSCSC